MYTPLWKDIEKMAKELVRLALAAEYKKIPLKRDEITKKGMYSLKMIFFPEIWIDKIHTEYSLHIVKQYWKIILVILAKSEKKLKNI